MNELWLIFIALLFSGFFSGIEIAVTGLNTMSLVTGNSVKLSALFKRKERLVAFCLVGNNLTIVGATLALDQYLEHEPLLAVKLIAFIAQVMLFFLFAELIPKAVFLRTNTVALSFLFYPIMALYGLFYPFTLLFFQLNRLMKRIFPAQAADQTEEIFHFVGSSMQGQGANSMTGGLLKLERLKIRELMTPFPEIYMLDEDQTTKESLAILEETSYSRYPVFDEKDENITGYVGIDDLLRAPPSRKIGQLKKEMTFAPESLSVDKALNMMKKDNLPMMMIVDEYGSLEGLLTMEDIAEVMLGDIRSAEQKHEIAEIEKTKNGYLIQASIDLNDFNEFFQLNLKKEDFDTLGGFIVNAVQGIPEKDEILEIEDLRFQILESDKRTIKTIKYLTVKNTLHKNIKP